MARQRAARKQEVPTGRANLTWLGEFTFGLVIFAWATALFMAAALPAAITTLTLMVVTYLASRRILWHIHTSRIKRRWYRNIRNASLRHIRPIPTGEMLDIHVHEGGSVVDIEKRAGPARELAAIMKVGNVRVKRNNNDGSRAQIVLARRDPFIPGEQLPWPHLDAKELSLYDPHPMGICDEGHQVQVSLFERCLLVCGVQKSGKSTLLNLFAAVGALDPNAQMWLFDGKEEIEFAPWERAATKVIGSDPTKALNAISQLKRLMRERQAMLRDEGKRLVPIKHPDYPPYLIIIDEATAYLDELPQKQASQFESDLRALVQRGRNAGIEIIVSTQKPQHTLIDTALRDLLTLRWVGSTTTSIYSDMGMGGKWAKLGYDASVIPRGQYGVGYLLAEDGLPQLMKSYYLTDDDVRAIAQRAVHRDERWKPPTPTAAVTAADHDND